MKIEVKGHSGCHIEIVNDGNQLYVEKSTDHSEYVPRLKEQALKQERAFSKTLQHIKIPEIYEIKESKSNLRIKMEYVYSKNYINYFEDSGFDDIRYFLKSLKGYIDDEIQNSPVTSIDSNIILNKFNDVSIKCKNNPLLKNDREIVEMLDKASKVCLNLPSKINIPMGTCHGDLTFSNILFNGNNYFLIDFLDSFIETPLMDIIKIRQDSCYCWSQLMYTEELDKIRLKIISEKIDKDIDDYYKRYDWYNKYYHCLQIMNFFRVLQYANEEKVVSYLKKIIISLL